MTEEKKKRALAYQSRLNDYAKEIQKWRRARMTWEQVTEKLKAEHGVEFSLQWVRSFYARYAKRKGRSALGFEPEPAAPVAIKPSKPAPKPVPPDALGVEVPHGTGTELFKKTKRRYGQ